jgi:hypothetical protein
VLVRGVYIDAEEEAGECVVFPVYYIRLFFQKERTKKERKMQEKMEKIDRIEQNNAVLSEKPTMNHSSAPVSPSIIKMSSKMDPEEVPIARKSEGTLPDIQFVNDVGQKISSAESATTKL